jgi:CHAT domain-containing protein/tetratricopeptide (TPR) repeat protein
MAQADRVQQAPTAPGDRAFAEALRAFDARDDATARALFEQALTLARESGDRGLEAGARRGLGAIAARQGHLREAVVEHAQAAALFDDLGDRLRLARSLNDLGTLHFRLAEPDLAKTNWTRALAEYEALGDAGQQASLLYNMAFLPASADERRALIERGLGLARAGGDRHVEGQLLAMRADLEFTVGDYVPALANLQQAQELFRQVGPPARSSLARALTSLGRLYRVHAQFDEAVDAYEAALAIQGELGDSQGMAQTTGALSRAFRYLGRMPDHLSYAERCHDLAVRAGGDAILTFGEAVLAAARLATGDSAGALALLRQADDSGRGRNDEWSQNLRAGAERAQGHAPEAFDAATRAVSLSRQRDNLETLLDALTIRSSVASSLGRLDAALADAREALAILERLRQRLVPQDYLKRGFTDQFRDAYSDAIDLLERLHRPEQAMEAAEAGRARAFADLLLARGVRNRPNPLGVDTAAALPSPPARNLQPMPTSGTDLLARGGGGGTRPRTTVEDLPSDASAPPATIGDLRRLAATLDVTILSYWVTRDHTWGWALGPEGRVLSMRAEVTEAGLRELVSRVWGLDSLPSGDEGLAPGRAVPGRRATAAPRRALDSADARRTLRRLLVTPLHDALPARSGSTLLIVPHGPLSLLSFAALQDERGRYLVEDHAIAYTPAAAVLMLSGHSVARARGAAREFLLVGSPATLPEDPGPEGLRPLPGAAREVRRVAATIGRARASVLVGRQASEPAVRRQMADARVVHLATHGVIRDDAPLDSFLALDVTGATGQADDDGRLGAREIYDLTLQADLVVLSACRSALGRLSGDGLFGVARAFFYAGTPSVVATLWDVADEPAARLMPRFHGAFSQGVPPSLALRTAQLALLADLRAGRVVVQGRRGPVPLPEHPALWAGFVLLGRP